MPYTGHTPESLLSRSDSKNPQTTCRGLTSTGRPCRRALASSPNSTPTKSASSSQSPFPMSSTSSSPQSIKFPSRIYNGVFAVAQDEDDKDVINAAFFCWQHKDQAASVMHVAKEEVVEVQGRSSIDTLVERFGVLEVKGEKDGIIRMASRRGGTDRRKSRRRVERDGQRMPCVKEEQYERVNERREKRSSLWSLLCCFSASTMEYDDDDDGEARFRQRQTHHDNPHRHDMYTRRPELSMTSHESTSITRPLPTVPHHSRPHRQHYTTSQAPRHSPQPTSPTYDYSNPSSLIPTHLPPSTRTALLHELTKPISPKDEPGYIYIFRLDASTTPSHSPTQPTQSPHNPTLLVKIGRTNNVHRRMTSWSKQCGYTLSLLRFYPYISFTPTPSPTNITPNANTSTTSNTQTPTQPQTLPYTHRIERLIHLELAAQRVKQSECVKCGREHKEWFEVEASREGVRGVDEVVRRWVGWGEWMGRG